MVYCKKEKSNTPFMKEAISYHNKSDKNPEKAFLYDTGIGVYEKTGGGLGQTDSRFDERFAPKNDVLLERDQREQAGEDLQKEILFVVGIKKSLAPDQALAYLKPFEEILSNDGIGWAQVAQWNRERIDQLIDTVVAGDQAGLHKLCFEPEQKPASQEKTAPQKIADALPVNFNRSPRKEEDGEAFILPNNPRSRRQPPDRFARI